LRRALRTGLETIKVNRFRGLKNFLAELVGIPPDKNAINNHNHGSV
jgi:hypothetical protein